MRIDSDRFLLDISSAILNIYAISGKSCLKYRKPNNCKASAYGHAPSDAKVSTGIEKNRVDANVLDRKC